MREGYKKKRKQTVLNNTAEKISDDAYAMSLCRIDADDIAPPPPRGSFSARGKRARMTRKLILSLSGLVFLGSLAMLVYTVADYARTQKVYEELNNFMFETENEEIPSAVPIASDSPMPNLDSMRSFRENNMEQVDSDPALAQYIAVMRAKISSIKAKNPDVIGYITVPNTKISYPILHTTDNEFYLNNNYLGEFSRAGAIFLDYRNYADIPINENSCIYGHNLTNGNMMNGVTEFLKEEFFKNNQYIEIITEKGFYTYQIFAVYKTDMYSDYITTYFPTPEAVCEFAYAQEARSLYKREGVTFEVGKTKLLTLSTCTNVIQEERYTVQAKLVQSVE